MVLSESDRSQIMAIARSLGYRDEGVPRMSPEEVEMQGIWTDARRMWAEGRAER